MRRRPYFRGSQGGGYNVTSSDLIARGYGSVADFLTSDITEWHGDIVTNPPYKYAQQFVEKAMSILSDGHKLAMFLKLQFLEGQARRQMFERYPPKTVYVASKRLMCAPNGDFSKLEGSAIAYAWYVWQKGFHGSPTIQWFN